MRRTEILKIAELEADEEGRSRCGSRVGTHVCGLGAGSHVSENRTKVIDILRREYKDGSVWKTECGLRLSCWTADCRG